MLLLVFGLLARFVSARPRGAAEERALVARALAGDAGAADALVRHLAPPLRIHLARLLRGRTVPGRELDDLVSEVWGRLFENGGQRLRAFDPALGRNLESYACLIAGQHLASTLRHALAEKRGAGQALDGLDEAVETPAPEPSPEALVSARGDARALLLHLEAELPERGRLILRLLYVDGLGPPEAAAALGVNLQVIYNWQHRIRGLADAWLSQEDA